MSIVDRVLVGKVIKDFGVLEAETRGIAKVTKSVLLVERKGERKIVLKSSSKAVFGAGVQYVDVKMSSLPKLRLMLDEAEHLAALGADAGMS